LEERDHEKGDFQSVNLHRDFCKGYQTMVMIFVISGIAVAAGIGCVFVRYPVLLLTTVCPALAAGTLLSGIRFGASAGLIVVEVFGSIAAPQVTFMAVSLARFGFKRYLARSSKLMPQVQTAIGQQLHAELEVPRTLSPDLARLVSQLSFA
jgi:phosphatidylserine decarboxylase